MILTCPYCQRNYKVKYAQGTTPYTASFCSGECFKKLLETYKDNLCLPPVSQILIDTPMIQVHTMQVQTLRSSYERIFAEWADKNNIKYKYEPYVVFLKKGMSYIPDFVIDDRIFIEIKGRWLGTSKTKFRTFRKKVNYPIILLDRYAISRLKKEAPAYG